MSIVPPSSELKMEALHGATTQKTTIYIQIAVKTSDPTKVFPFSKL
jgi:hypothetical protein